MWQTALSRTAQLRQEQTVPLNSIDCVSRYTTSVHILPLSRNKISLIQTLSSCNNVSLSCQSWCFPASNQQLKPNVLDWAHQYDMNYLKWQKPSCTNMYSYWLLSHSVTWRRWGLWPIVVPEPTGWLRHCGLNLGELSWRVICWENIQICDVNESNND